jgi:hypothetical protein
MLTMVVVVRVLVGVLVEVPVVVVAVFVLVVPPAVLAARLVGAPAAPGMLSSASSSVLCGPIVTGRRTFAGAGARGPP